MRIQLVAVGRLKTGPERELVERYRGRATALARSLGFAGPDIAELPESRRRSVEERQAEEAAAIRARAGVTRLVILDETAPSIASDDFSRRIAADRDRGSALAFVIGGPDGLAPELKAEAGWALSFGRLTLPHQLVRVLLLEQIYRAFTIIAGHPYHRSGVGEP